MKFKKSLIFMFLCKSYWGFPGLLPVHEIHDVIRGSLIFEIGIEAHTHIDNFDFLVHWFIDVGLTNLSENWKLQKILSCYLFPNQNSCFSDLLDLFYIFLSYLLKYTLTGEKRIFKQITAFHKIWPADFRRTVTHNNFIGRAQVFFL